MPASIFTCSDITFTIPGYFIFLSLEGEGNKTEGFYPDSKAFQMALKTEIWTEIAKSIFRCDDKDYFDDLHTLICE